MPQPKKIELVIPVYNRREITLQGLRSLRRIDRRNLETHIIVVDDGSTDGTSEAIQKDFPEVQIIKGNGTLHYAAGTNRGISAALERNPDYIVTMNDDAIFHEQFLQRLVKNAEANPHSIVGALLLLWNEPHRVFQIDFKWKTSVGGWFQPEDATVFDFPPNAFEVEGMAGNCVLYPVEAIRECGLMDEKKFPHGWGDIQYVVRMKRKGWRLLVEPKSFVWCEPNTYPKPLHQTSMREVLQTLLRNRRHPLNLQRQFIARWESAPSKTQAFLSFLIYIFTLSGKTLKFTAKTNK
ncbi:MAG TPA: glycosyltransferase family 2 protein [Pyrinomonadaceae bacterium]|nr:glycosyltransferase family 2 protein [Pyrinomonadaceae bacterium]